MRPHSRAGYTDPKQVDVRLCTRVVDREGKRSLFVCHICDTRSLVGFPSTACHTKNHAELDHLVLLCSTGLINEAGHREVPLEPHHPLAAGRRRLHHRSSALRRVRGLAIPWPARPPRRQDIDGGSSLSPLRGRRETSLASAATGADFWYLPAKSVQGECISLGTALVLRHRPGVVRRVQCGVLKYLKCFMLVTTLEPHVPQARAVVHKVWSDDLLFDCKTKRLPLVRGDWRGTNVGRLTGQHREPSFEETLGASEGCTFSLPLRIPR